MSDIDICIAEDRDSQEISTTELIEFIAARDKRIADLGRQLAEAQAEIEAMRTVVEAATAKRATLIGWVHDVGEAVREYEARKPK